MNTHLKNVKKSINTTDDQSKNNNKKIENGDQTRGITAISNDECVDFVALWSASDISEQTGMDKRWVFRNYTVEIWDIPPSDPNPGSIVGELKASSYARIIDRTDNEYLVESPINKAHGWLDKSHVKTISKKTMLTKKLCNE